MPSKKQSERFKEAARTIGADQSGEAFERAFTRLVPPKRSPTDISPAPMEKLAEKLGQSDPNWTKDGKPKFKRD